MTQIVSNQNQKERIAFLEKKIETARRNKERSTIVFFAGLAFFGFFIAGLMERIFEGGVIELAPSGWVRLVVALALLAPACFAPGIFLERHYTGKVNEFEKEYYKTVSAAEKNQGI